MNERIRYALVMLGHLPPRDDDEQFARLFFEVAWPTLTPEVKKRHRMGGRNAH